MKRQIFLLLSIYLSFVMSSWATNPQPGASVTFTRDSNTHNPPPSQHTFSSAVMCLPGDLEKISFTLNQVNAGDVRFRIANQSIAVMKSGVFYAQEMPAPQSSSEVVVRGLRAGVTLLEAYCGQPSNGDLLGSIAIYVGGNIEIEYEKVPTFPVTGTFAPVAGQEGSYDSLGQDPTTLITVVEDDDPSTFPVTSGFMAKPHVNTLISSTTKESTTIEVKVTDALGNPKKGRKIFIEFGDGILSIQQATATLDANGNATFTNIEYSGQAKPASVITLHEQINFYLGEAAERAEQGEEFGLDAIDLSKWQNGTGPSEYFESEFTYDFKTLTFNTGLPDQTNAYDSKTAKSFHMPLVSNPTYHLLHMWGKGTNVPNVFSPTGQMTFNSTSVTVQATDYEYPFSVTDPEYREYQRDSYQDYIENNDDIEGTISDSPDTSGPTLDSLIAIAAIEIGKAVVPGADAIDLFVEFLWKPLIKDEAPDKLIAVLAGVGLLADFGHLIPGVGNLSSVAVNTAVGVIRGAIVAIKKLNGGAEFVEALFKMTRSLKDTGILIFRYLRKVPGSGAVAKVGKVLEAWDHMLKSTLLNSASRVIHMTSAYKMLGKFSDKWFRKQAQEGVAFAIQSGKKNAAKKLFEATTTGGARKYSDEVLENTFDYVRVLNTSTKVLANLSDDAIEGLAVAVKATGQNHIWVKEILEGTAMTTNRLDVAFTKIKDLGEDVTGMSLYVKSLRNNKNNLNGIDGVIHEGTVAAAVKNGNLSGSGNLAEIAAERAGQWKIDTISSNWGAQVKHKAGTGNYGKADLSGWAAYLNDLRDEANALNLTPVFITNRSATSGFLSECTSRGILYRVVAELTP